MNTLITSLYYITFSLMYSFFHDLLLFFITFIEQIYIRLFTYVFIRVIILLTKKGAIKMPITPRDMIKLLKENGFKEVSQRGSHVKLVNPVTKKQTTVPYHAKSLKKGLEQAILKQAGLK